MASVGTSAQKGRNTLCTWFEARAWLDRRFEALRLAVAVELGEDYVAYAVFLRRHRLAWQQAIRALKGKLLLQRANRGKYDRVRTVHEGKKVKPRNSRKLERLNARRRNPGQIGKLKKDRDKRSHDATGKPVGRRKLPDEERKRRELRQAKRKAAKRRKESTRKYHPRGTPRPERPSGPSLSAARARVEVKKREDERANHDTRYGYRAPVHRIRAKDGKRSKPGIRKTGSAGNPGAALILIARSLRTAESRSARLRDYWRKVRLAAQ